MIYYTPPIQDVAAWMEKMRSFAYGCVKRNVLEHPFVRDVTDGSLPKEKLQEFFRQWYSFALEVNTSMGTLYHRFNALFRTVAHLF